jgi:hypothetical protein
MHALTLDDGAGCSRNAQPPPKQHHPTTQIRPRSPGEAASGLPRDLHLALLAAMMLAQTAGTGLQGQHGCALLLLLLLRQQSRAWWLSCCITHLPVYSSSARTPTPNTLTDTCVFITHVSPSHSVSHDDLRQLASAALSAADVVRRTTLRRLRDIFGHARLQARSLVCGCASCVHGRGSACAVPCTQPLPCAHVHSNSRDRTHCNACAGP